MKFMPTAEDRELQAKLENLQSEFERTQERMRQAAIDYENLIVHKQTLVAEIEELKAQAAKRRQALVETCSLGG